MIRKIIGFLTQRNVFENVLGKEKLSKKTSMPAGDVCVLGISKL